MNEGCGRYPPEVRTAIPVEERFEHIVLSSNATSDHAIIWIEREARKALERMKESSEEVVTTAPMVQKLERLQTLQKEHKDALERAVSLNVPHATTEEEQPPPLTITGEEEASSASAYQDTQTEDKKSKSERKRTNWSDIVEKLFSKSDSGELALKEDIKIEQ
ncbi:hypothetical protein C5167_023000 [Papaver somniferum]|uniref:Uncharacterized protein n=1 Tax=Papaver somniferum TaxID=3469 RepID=A0A4Y7JN59_PAPSO|nr:hypothetical protein C5167_023000 [Papaver somniferum]